MASLKTESVPVVSGALGLVNKKKFLESTWKKIPGNINIEELKR